MFVANPVVQITRSDCVRAKFTSEFCVEGPHSAVQKILRFEFRNRSYLVLARKNGFVQLFESGRKQPGEAVAKLSFKLFKEWKNACLTGHDTIVLLGVAHGRFLYSCSAEGKLIFRDLLNDDSDKSNRIFLVQKPVSGAEVREMGAKVVQVVCAGKGNAVKTYSVDLAHHHQDHGVRRSDVCCTIVGLGGANWWNGDGASAANWSYAVPTWVGQSEEWFTCAAYVESGVVCGTQDGFLLLFKEGTHAAHRVSLSHSPIRDVTVHSGHVVCHDSMSKVVVLDPELAVLRVYDRLKIGPVSSCRFAFSDPSARRRKLAGLEPTEPPVMFVVATNLENRMVIYRLAATAQLVLNMELMGTAPCFDLIGPGPIYELLLVLCGQPVGSEAHKRRHGQWEPVGCAPVVCKDELRSDKS